jgi:hypothetical protein
MKFKLLGVLAIGLLTSLHAFSDLQINGFASVVSGIDLEDDGNPTDDYGSRTVDNLQDSKVALQFTADLEKGIRFVGQTMARGNAETGFALNYDWAYFDFDIGDSAKLKFGRLRIPFYKYSDYLDVGYAYHWVSPPASMYSLSFSNMDGIGYQQNFQTGGIEHALNMTLGQYQGVLMLAGVPADSRLENLVAINWTTIVGNHEFSAAYAQADVYVPAAAAEGLATAATGLGLNGRDVLIDGDYGFFIGIGYKGSFGDVTVFTEYSMVDVEDSINASSEGGYLGVSYSMADYTYHVTYGTSKSEEETYGSGAADADLGAGASLNSSARSLGNGDSTTITLGVRKDIGATTAIKMDLDLYTEDRVQTGLIAAVSEEQKATILKFAVETMF